MLTKLSVYLCISTVLFIAGCGKKQRNLFVFESQPKIKFHTLDLPPIKGISLSVKDNIHYLNWFPITQEHLPDIHVTFEGYSVFQTTKAGVVHKKSLNKEPLKEACFLRDINKKSTGYMVRGIFKLHKELLLGPASRIIRVPAT